MSTLRVEPDETSAEAGFTSARPLDCAPGILLLIGMGVRGKCAQIWWNALAQQQHWTGLNTDIRQIARTGWRPLVVAVIGPTVCALVSQGIVLLTSRVFGWGTGI